MPHELNTAGSEARARFYRDALNAFELVKTGKPVSILMLGDSGIGKSYLACWMIHELLRTMSDFSMEQLYRLLYDNFGLLRFYEIVFCTETERAYDIFAFCRL